MSQIFGFSDGLNFYINPSYPDRLKIKEDFAKAKGNERYLYYAQYEGLSYNPLMPTFPNSLKAGSWEGNKVTEMIFDTKTKIKVRLTIMSLKMVLESDEELLNRFKKESEKRKKLKKYFLEYCERNPN